MNSRLTDLLFDVVTGQQRPLAGQVQIDGRPAAELAAARGRSSLVLLERDPAVFHGTLIENMSGFGGLEQADLAVEYAAALGLAKRVNRLPFGYNTQLGIGDNFERDPVNRQLISLVRAFSLKPSILLMNEPTAILDQDEREALKSFIAGLEDRPTILMYSPDPRMKSLANTSITATVEVDQTLQAFRTDAQSDGVSYAQKGAA